jgi:hypothetical protein
MVAGESKPLTLDVEESPESVAKAIERARDAVEFNGPDGRRYYVNPASVAYWTELAIGGGASA